MIRFIDLGDQILEGQREFAWWNTISDVFFQFSGEEAWETWEEFEASFYDDDDNRKEIIDLKITKPLQRYKTLFPKKWP